MGIDGNFERGEVILDISNVFVIIGKEWTKDKVIDEIVAENYKHNFLFGVNHTHELLIKEMDLAEEIWIFGDCEDDELYIHAKKSGFDIWEMG